MDEALAALVRAHGLEAVRAALGRVTVSAQDAGSSESRTIDLAGLLRTEGAGATRSDEPAPSAQRIAGRYEDLGPIARGGMAEIRRAHDHLLDRVVALKLMQPGMLDQEAWRARFVQEARHTARLQHPAIVPVHDFGRLEDGRYWFAMAEVRRR